MFHIENIIILGSDEKACCMPGLKRQEEDVLAYIN